MTGCTGPKSAQKSVNVYVAPAGTHISSSSFLVCSGGTSFSIDGLPSGTTIHWGSSSNVHRVSQDGANPCTFNAAGAGDGYVEATISNCRDSVMNIQVMAGTPQPDTIDIQMDAPPHRFTATLRHYVPTANSYNWYLDGVLNTMYHNDMAIFNRKSPYCGGEYHLEVQAVNDCGSSLKTSKLVFEPECLYKLLVSPNPTADETTVELVDESSATPITDADWDMEVYDQNQLLKEKQTKIKGNLIKLKTSNWKEGIYYIVAQYNDKLFNEKLVVKH